MSTTYDDQSYIGQNGTTIIPEEGQRRGYDYYRTPDRDVLASFVYLEQLYPLLNVPNILDMGAGDGQWGKPISRGTDRRERLGIQTVHGIEIRDEPRPAWYDHWWMIDLRSNMLPDAAYDLIIGNPPFSLAADCVRIGMQSLRVGGIMAYMLPWNFYATKKRAMHLFREFPCVHIAAYSDRPSFFKGKKSSTDMREYGFFVWEKRPETKASRRYHTTAGHLVQDELVGTRKQWQEREYTEQQLARLHPYR